MSHDTVSFIALCTGLLVFLLVVSVVSKNYSLNRIKSKTVGDGQHGTARWATLKEIGKTYAHIPFDVAALAARESVFLKNKASWSAAWAEERRNGSALRSLGGPL